MDRVFATAISQTQLKSHTLHRQLDPRNSKSQHPVLQWSKKIHTQKGEKQSRNTHYPSRAQRRHSTHHPLVCPNPTRPTAYQRPVAACATAIRQRIVIQFPEYANRPDSPRTAIPSGVLSPRKEAGRTNSINKSPASHISRGIKSSGFQYVVSRAAYTCDGYADGPKSPAAENSDRFISIRKRQRVVVAAEGRGPNSIFPTWSKLQGPPKMRKHRFFRHD